jgi:phosphopantothenoylcysteine decarboxylase/phosphopantothenate--cysteine ligase
MSLRDKKVIVGLTGGIACYKVPYLVRYLVKAGAQVQVVMTDAATRFITPLTLETVSRNLVYTDMFPEHEFVSVRHIELAQWADLFVIAPATANFLGKVNSGICDDLLTTMVCATSRPVLIAPAMNPRMWSNKITQRNVASLTELGYKFIGPAEGEMAEQAFGVGRMVEPDELFEAVKKFFEDRSKKKALSGRRILVTAGPCREPLDPVRYISNRSSGKMGYAIAQAAADNGASVTLISGPTKLAPPENVEFVSIETTSDLQKAVSSCFAKSDCLIMAAAPSDFRPAQASTKKLKRTSAGLSLALEPTVDILKALAPRKKPGQVVMGFALETDDELANAKKKLKEKKLDLIVLNSAREAGAGFEHDTNRVTLLQPGRSPEEWPLMSKKDVAERLIERVAKLLVKGYRASRKAR